MTRVILNGKEVDPRVFADRPALPLAWARLHLELQTPCNHAAVDLLQCVAAVARSERDLKVTLEAMTQF